MSTLSETDGTPAYDAPDTTRTHVKDKKRKNRRRIAKALAWVSVALIAVMVLSEPWLLLPVITLVVALSLWD